MNVRPGLNDRLALRPDLDECLLEDRVLLAIEPGLYPSAFMQVNSSSNQLIVPGTSTPGGGGSGGGSTTPGPSFYYIFLGSNANSVSSGSRVGGSVSLYTITNLRVLPSGAMVHTINGAPSLGGGGGGGGGGSGADSGGGGGNASGSSNVGGYGVSFSSGYGFALGSGNNYGMFSGTGATTTLGSVPVHTYGGGGDIMEGPDAQNGNGKSPNENPSPVPGGAPNTWPGYGPQGPNAKFYENLLGKNPGRMGVQTGGPAGGEQGPP